MIQKWRDLFFLHWKCEPKEIQQTLPPGLFVDTFEGSAFIGIVPFEVKGVRTHFLPPIPGISHFLEVNVRTYVFNERNEKGIWFYSLDANQLLATLTARHFFKLPYYKANIGLTKTFQSFHFWLQRQNTNVISSFNVTHGEELFRAEPKTLDHFLIERYRLFTVDQKGKLLTLTVSHQQYLLAKGQVIEMENHLFAINHLSLPITNMPINTLYSPGVDVKISTLKPIK